MTFTLTVWIRPSLSGGWLNKPIPRYKDLRTIKNFKYNKFNSYKMSNGGDNTSINPADSAESGKLPPESKINTQLIVLIGIIIAAVAILYVLYQFNVIAGISFLGNAPVTTFSSANSSSQATFDASNIFKSSSNFNISYNYSSTAYSSVLGVNHSTTTSQSAYISKYGEYFKNVINNSGIVNTTVYNGSGLTECLSFLGLPTCTFTPVSSDAINKSGIFSQLFNNSATSNLMGSVKNSSFKNLGEKTYNGNRCTMFGLSTVLKNYSVSFGISSAISGYIDENICISDEFGVILYGNIGYEAKVVTNSSFIGTAVTGGVVDITSKLGPAPTQSEVLSLPNRSSSGFGTGSYNGTIPGIPSNPNTVDVNGTSCGNFSTSTYPSSHIEGTCNWTGGIINISYAGGTAGYASVTLTGENSKVYYSNSTTLWCSSDPAYSIINLPAQQYTVRLGAGRGGGDCGDSYVKLSG